MPIYKKMEWEFLGLMTLQKIIIILSNVLGCQLNNKFRTICKNKLQNDLAVNHRVCFPAWILKINSYDLNDIPVSLKQKLIRTKWHKIVFKLPLC